LPQIKHHREVGRRLRSNAGNLRRAATDAESVMWQILRGRRFAGFKFRRQVPFQNFILDFVCFEKGLVIEVDGSQHANSSRDEARDALLASEGFETLRYWNNAVLGSPRLIQEDIWNRLKDFERNPSPGASLRSAPPSPTREEGKRTRGES
jgi:very-short-patch-repair endonuclease